METVMPAIRSDQSKTPKVAVVVSRSAALNWRLENWLRSYCQLRICHSMDELLAGDNVQTVDLVILVSNRSRSFHQCNVDQVIAMAPFVRMVCINSAWSDGESRNGRQLTGVVQIHWASAVVYLERWIRGTIKFPLSRVQNTDLELPLVDSDSVSGKSVCVVGDWRVTELWNGVLNEAGIQRDSYSDAVTSDVLLIDCSRRPDSEAKMIADAIERFHGSQVVLVLHMPREHEVAMFKRAGVDHVLRHPVALADVMSVIQIANHAESISDAA